MPEIIRVVFDASTSSSGPYYLLGEIVKHDRRVCRVQSTRKISGTRYEAVLAVIEYPSEDETAQAAAWDRRSLGM